MGANRNLSFGAKYLYTLHMVSEKRYTIAISSKVSIIETFRVFAKLRK